MIVNHGESVILEKFLGSKRNAHGQPQPTYGEGVVVENVGVDVPSVSEPRDAGTHNVRFDYRLFFPPGSVVKSRDRVRVRGFLCEVEQPGEEIKNFFTGSVFRTEVLVRRVQA